MVASLGEGEISCYRFHVSEKISTYLYCVVAGDYDIFTPSEATRDENIPMRLLCRKSLSKYVKEMSEDWFRVSKSGIKFYEEIFSTPYPFGKFD
jgi:aminopeptidase N